MLEEEEEAVAPSKRKGPTERPPLDPEEAKRKAQALIESTLAQATASARAEAAAAAAPPPPAPALEPPTPPVVPAQVVPPRRVAKPKAVVVQEAALPEALLAAEDKFELPQYITHPGEADVAAPEPAPSREQQAAIIAEAAARKERRKLQVRGAGCLTVVVTCCMDCVGSLCFDQ